MSVVGAAVSIGAAAVSLVFSAIVLRIFLERRRPYNLMWGIGLLMFTLVAFVQVAAELGQWTDGLFRAWYFLGTGLVAFLGAGSVYIAHRKLGHVFAAYVVVLFLAFLAVALTAPTDPVEIGKFGNPDTTGRIVAPSGSGWAAIETPSMFGTPRIFSPLFTIPGSVTLIGIALYGLVRYRLLYNLYIAGGAVVLAIGTGLARFGDPSLIYSAEFAGIAVLFVGFWKAVEWAREHRKDTPAGGPPPARTGDGEPEAVPETTPK